MKFPLDKLNATELSKPPPLPLPYSASLCPGPLFKSKEFFFFFFFKSSKAGKAWAKRELREQKSWGSKFLRYPDSRVFSFEWKQSENAVVIAEWCKEAINTD